jgi:hypothetical protein
MGATAPEEMLVTNEEKKKIYAALAAPFPDVAVERTDARVTGKGYSTTGLKYQYVVNRMNEVLGLGGWRVHRTIRTKAITTSKGRPAYESIAEVTVEIGQWIDGQFVAWADAVADGGHVSGNEADSIKGSHTNAIKKCCAFFGVGKAAYEGSLDDDSVPQEIGDGFTMSVLPSQPQRSAAPTAPVPQPAPAQRPAPTPSRNRLTSRQLSAIWALGRKLGYEQQDLRQFVKGKYSCQPEFLSRDSASALIGAMSEQAGNGQSQEQHEPRSEG